MSKHFLMFFVLLHGALLPGAAHAGEGRPAWYDQAPWAGTGVGLYYSQHPDHIPAYPKRLNGVVVPLYESQRSVPSVAKPHRPCAARAERRHVCRSPYR